MQTSVWREILDDSISGDKLAGGTVNPPFDLVYVKRMFLGSPSRNYPVIWMGDEDSATFGLGWNFGYGKINNYLYHGYAIESPTPSDASPFVRVQGRAGSQRMVEMTMDRATRCGILYVAMNGATRFQVYPSGTSYMQDKFVFGGTVLNPSYLSYPYQFHNLALFTLGLRSLGTIRANGSIICEQDIVSTYNGSYQNTTLCVGEMWEWYSQLIGIGFEDLIENEVTQIKGINGYTIPWDHVETIDQDMNSTDSVSFNIITALELRGSSPDGLYFRHDVIPVSPNTGRVGTLALRFSEVHSRSVRTDEVANYSGSRKIGEWYPVSNISVGETDGIGVSTAVIGSSVVTHDVKWCWRGMNTITLSGFIQISVPSPGAGITALEMNGAFDWAAPKNINERGFGCWFIHPYSSDRAACLLSTTGVIIVISPLVNGTKMTGYLDFSITYEVDGPIPT